MIVSFKSSGTIRNKIYYFKKKKKYVLDRCKNENFIKYIKDNI